MVPWGLTLFFTVAADVRLPGYCFPGREQWLGPSLHLPIFCFLFIDCPLDFPALLEADDKEAETHSSVSGYLENTGRMKNMHTDSP